MAITIQTQIRENYLFVNCYGVFSKEDLLEAADKSLEVAIRENLKKLLFDSRELKGNPPTTMERFELGRAFADMQRNKKEMIKCAFLGKEPMVDPERFSETVIVNRGGLFAVFTDIDDAIKWLNE